MTNKAKESILNRKLYSIMGNTKNTNRNIRGKYSFLIISMLLEKYIYAFSCFSSLCSGLSEILEIVFAANSVKHMLTDKATSRTSR